MLTVFVSYFLAGSSWSYEHTFRRSVKPLNVIQFRALEVKLNMQDAVRKG
jgi:hypothetical protein